MKPTSNTPLVFAGLKINRETNGTVTLDQKDYILSLEKQDDNCTFDTFRSYRHKPAWIDSSRPDIMARSNIFSQVTEAKFEPKHFKTT